MATRGALLKPYSARASPADHPASEMRFGPPPELCRGWGVPWGRERVRVRGGEPTAWQHSLPYLLLALGAQPHALGRRLEGRVQAAQVVCPRAGAAGLQVGPSLARGAVLIVGDLTLKEKGGREAGRQGREGAGAPPGQLPPRPARAPLFLSSSGRGRDEPGNRGDEQLPGRWTQGHHLGHVHQGRGVARLRLGHGVWVMA